MISSKLSCLTLYFISVSCVDISLKLNLCFVSHRQKQTFQTIYYKQTAQWSVLIGWKAWRLHVAKSWEIGSVHFVQFGDKTHLLSKGIVDLVKAPKLIDRVGEQVGPPLSFANLKPDLNYKHGIIKKVRIKLVRFLFCPWLASIVA